MWIWYNSSVGLSGPETSNQTFIDIQFISVYIQIFLHLTLWQLSFSWFLHPAFVVPHSNSGFLCSQCRVDFKTFCSLFPSAWCGRWASQRIVGDLRFWNARKFGWKFQLLSCMRPRDQGLFPPRSSFTFIDPKGFVPFDLLHDYHNLRYWAYVQQLPQWTGLEGCWNFQLHCLVHTPLSASGWPEGLSAQVLA